MLLSVGITIYLFYRSVQTRKFYKKIPREKLEAAVNFVLEKKGSQSEASVEYGIPRSTIRYYLKNPEYLKNPRKKGPATKLSKTEEEELKDWILDCGKKGYCPR